MQKYKELLYILCTISSAFVFLFLFTINEFEQSHFFIYSLILTSIIYKAFYFLFYKHYTFLVSIINKADYICIFNLLWKHCHKYFLFTTIQHHIYWFIIFLSLFYYKYFHCVLSFLYIITIIHLFFIDKFLSIIFTIVALFIIYSYYNFTKYGWNIVNSWIWHISICVAFLCVKISYIF